MLIHRATRYWPTAGTVAISFRLIAVAMVLMATAVFAPGASAAPEQKTYTADVDPDAGAGQTIPFTITIVNTTKTQQLGSANLSAPSSFSLISAVPSIPGGGSATIAGSTGGTVQLRNLTLPPGGTRTATFTAEVPCSSGSYTWSIIAKQSNNFSGTPGNNFILTAAASDLVTEVSGQCSLAWRQQPADTRTGDRITNTQYDAFLGPAGPDFIEVEVLSAPYSSNPADTTLVSFSTDRITLNFGNDASGGTAKLGGTVSVNADGGVATFDPGPTIDVAGVNYTLLAQLASNYVTPVTDESASFDISDAVCEVKNGRCTTPLTGVGTRARATIEGSTIDGGFVAVSVGVLIDAVYCSGYAPPPGEQAVAILPSGLDGDPTLIVEATLDASIVDAGTVPWSQLLVCWAQTSEFTGLNGPAPEVTIAGEPQRQDLLLACDPSGRDLMAPCQLPSIRNNRTGAVTLRVFASGTDPFKR